MGWWSSPIGGWRRRRFVTRRVIPAEPAAPAIQGSGHEVNVVGGSGAHVWAYGETKIGGPVVYAEAVGENNTVRLQLVALTGHECERVGDIYADGDIALAAGDPDGSASHADYADYLAIYRATGADGQQAHADLLDRSAVWEGTGRLAGIANLYCRLLYDADAFRNVPVVTAIVRGRKVLPLDANPGAARWSRNPAECIADFLRSHPQLRARPEQIDGPMFRAARDACDEQVALPGGTNRPRYASDGYLSLDGKPADALDSLVDACGGILTYSQGRYKLRAGVWDAPTVTLDEDDFAGGISLSSDAPARDRYNTVRGRFRGRETEWVMTDYPAQVDEGALARDGRELEVQMDTPWTDSAEAAQRLAHLALARMKEPMTVTATFGARAYELDPGDNVAVSFARYGWERKAFEVVSWRCQPFPSLRIELTLRETSAAVYEWSPGSAHDFHAGDTQLTPITDREYSPPGYLIERELRRIDGLPVRYLIVTVPPLQPWVRFDIQLQSDAPTLRRLEDGLVRLLESGITRLLEPGLGGWAEVASGPAGRYEIPLNAGDIHHLRFRGVTERGAVSDWTETKIVYPMNLGTPPDVAGFAAIASEGVCTFSWDAETAYRWSEVFEIRATPDSLATAEWSSASVLLDNIPGDATSVRQAVSPGARTFLIRAFNALGQGSASAAKFRLDVPASGARKTVATLTADPAFLGTLTDCVRGPSGTTAWIELAQDAGGAYEPAGSYEYSVSHDLGGVFSVVLDADMQFERRATAVLWDDIPGRFTTWLGLWDDWGTGVDAQDVRAFATVAWSAVEHPAPPDANFTAHRPLDELRVRARHIRLGASLSTRNGKATPRIGRLRLGIALERRTLSGHVATDTGANAKEVFFSPSFHTLESVVATMTDGATGDYYLITGKSSAGFSIRAFDSDNHAVARNFDWTAVGLG